MHLSRTPFLVQQRNRRNGNARNPVPWPPYRLRSPDYPQPDGSVYLNGTPSKSLVTLLKKTDLEQALVLGETNITEAQYQEIKDFTDDLVKDCTDDTGKYNAIFKWDSTNIVYDYAGNDPYPVFTSRWGICQGYSNLMKVMLLTQGIPVLVANGYCYGMGHAWNYTYCGGKWIICDATNKGSFSADALSTYTHLSPKFEIIRGNSTGIGHITF